MSDRPPPGLLYLQAIDSHGQWGTDVVRREYQRLMVQHGHLIPRLACICIHAPTDPAEHEPGCPRYQDNDRRLACGWLPGEDRRTRR